MGGGVVCVHCSETRTEDATTIRKATVQTTGLASGVTDPQSLNQATRWINTKDDHANKIIFTMGDYFLAQRVVPVERGAAGYEAYLEKLAAHHAVMRAAMKTKQVLDPAACDKLDDALHTLGHVYDH